MNISKKAFVWLVVGVGIAVVASWWILTSISDVERQPSGAIDDAALFKEQYPAVEEDNRFVFASTDQIADIFSDGDGLVFLGFPECPWCQQLAPIVDEAARAENLEQVYYLNIRENRASDDETYQSLVSSLEEYLPRDDDGNPRILVPDVTMVVQGEIAGRFQQEPADDGETVTPETYWTAERRERAVEQLRQLIRG